MKPGTAPMKPLSQAILLGCNKNVHTKHNALKLASIGGGSMKSKESRSLMPMALSDSIVLARFVRCISGTAVGNISSLYARSVYNR